MRHTLWGVALVAFSLSMYAADEPTFKLGGTLVTEYAYQPTPEPERSAFNVNRAYINFTGTLNKWIAFRVTPDVARELGGGSSLSGSQQYRLKFAYAQFNLDDWMTKGSFARFGMQQTPYVDYVEQIYRYRFQGTIFVEREEYLASSDNGISMRYALPSDYGDIHAGFYNGEGYNKSEPNHEKAIQIRATLRPLPKSPRGKGLRATIFHDADHASENVPRERLVGQLSYEHARFNFGADVISTKDRDLQGRGWSAFATPRFGKGWELLLRHDHNRPDRDSSLERTRNIIGIAYWIPNLQKVTAAVLVDRDSLSVSDKADETRYGVKMMLSF